MSLEFIWDNLSSTSGHVLRKINEFYISLKMWYLSHVLTAIYMISYREGKLITDVVSFRTV